MSIKVAYNAVCQTTIDHMYDSLGIQTYAMQSDSGEWAFGFLAVQSICAISNW